MEKILVFGLGGQYDKAYCRAWADVTAAIWSNTDTTGASPTADLLSDAFYIRSDTRYDYFTNK